MLVLLLLLLLLLPLPSSATARRATSAARVVARARTGKLRGPPDLPPPVATKTCSAPSITCFLLASNSRYVMRTRPSIMLRARFGAYCRICLSTSYSDVRHCSRWRLASWSVFGIPTSNNAHPLGKKGGVLPLLRMSINVLSLVCLLVKVVAWDVVPTYLGHRKSRASNIIYFV